MRIVLDTNVLISGVFFSGPPSKILDACFTGQHELAVSPEIIEEYSRVGTGFSGNDPHPDFARFLGMIVGVALLVSPQAASEAICADSDDDKFFHCALASGATHIVSGDKHLLAVSGHGGITVIRPREFMDTCMENG